MSVTISREMIDDIRELVNCAQYLIDRHEARLQPSAEDLKPFQQAAALVRQTFLCIKGFPDLDVDIAFYFLDTKTGLRC